MMSRFSNDADMICRILISAYKPPTSLNIHLSKIPMPELIPRAPNPSPVPSQSRNPSHNNALRGAATSDFHSKESSSKLRRSPPQHNSQSQRPVSALLPSTPADGPLSPPRKGGAMILPKATSSQNLRVGLSANGTLVPGSLFSHRFANGGVLQPPSLGPNGLHPGAQAYYSERDFNDLGPYPVAPSTPPSQSTPTGGFFGKVFSKS
jgi:hypothetical protein